MLEKAKDRTAKKRIHSATPTDSTFYISKHANNTSGQEWNWRVTLVTISAYRTYYEVMIIIYMNKRAM